MFVLFLSLFNECGVFWKYAKGNQTSSCTTSVRFDQMLQSSCNPTSFPPPPFHPYTRSVGQYGARERGFYMTIRQTYCDHCKDWQKAVILAVPSTKQREITRWSSWYPPFLLRGISLRILPLYYSELSKPIKIISVRRCISALFSVTLHVWVRMTICHVYRLQEMLLNLDVSAQVYCCRCWAGLDSSILCMTSIRDREALLNFKAWFVRGITQMYSL